MMMGVLSLAALSIPVGWIVFLAIFIVAKTGFATSLIFYDSMLVDITTYERLIKFLHTDMLGAISVVVFLLQSVYY